MHRQTKETEECWLCGANGASDPLDRHHIFGGPYRKKSEKYGLVVYLCHNKCHIFGPNSAHQSKETTLLLHKYGQKVMMENYGWTTERFIREFGKNYA